MIEVISMTNRIEDIGTRKLKNQIFLKVILLAETSDNKNVDVVCFFCREKFSNLKSDVHVGHYPSTDL